MTTVQRLRQNDAILLIVDLQERLVPVIHEAERVVRSSVLLARAARRLRLPVLVTEQYPEKLGATVEAVAQATECVAEAKLLFSAGSGATLAALRATARKSVLLCGIEAHVCVLQTALDLLEASFTVFVPYDAVSSRRPDDKQAGWERLRHAGAVPTSAESAIFEMLREAGTPDFKALLPLLK